MIDSDYRTHLTTGTNDCLVCDQKLYGSWTDYNGQIRCSECGATYQLIGKKFTDEFLTENGLSAADIKTPYCDVFELVPMLREHWQDTKQPSPFGTYLGGAPPHVSQWFAPFYGWLAEHADKWRPLLEDSFNWNVILERFGATFAAGQEAL